MAKKKKDIKQVMSRIHEEDAIKKKELAEKAELDKIREAEKNEKIEKTESVDEKNIDKNVSPDDKKPSSGKKKKPGKNAPKEIEKADNTDNSKVPEEPAETAEADDFEKKILEKEAKMQAYEEASEGTGSKNRHSQSKEEKSSKKGKTSTQKSDDSDNKEVMTEDMDPVPAVKEKREFRSKILMDLVGGVLIIAGVILLIMLNTPARRYERNMLKADKLYSEGNYQEAIVKYEKAVKIKETSVNAYLGILNAKEASSAADLKDSFIGALDTFRTFDDATKEENRNLITEYVLHENAIFADDTADRLNVLEDGYELTDGAEDIKRILTEFVEETVEEDRYSGEFDEAMEVIERFSDKADIDSVNITKEIETEKEVYELKVSILTDAYNALKDYYALAAESKERDPLSYDFSAILSLDGSEKASSLVKTQNSNSYMYIPSENFNEGSGVGSGLYTFGEFYQTESGELLLPYYFYVGNFEDGLRNGYGIAFSKTGNDSFTMYEGIWKDDLPDGEGRRTELLFDEEGNKYTRTIKGSWLKGLADGPMSVTVTDSIWPDTVFSGTVEAVEGEGKTVPTENEEYVVQNLRSDNLIGVLQSDTEGYALMITLWQKEGTLVDALNLYRSFNS